MNKGRSVAERSPVFRFIAAGTLPAILMALAACGGRPPGVPAIAGTPSEEHGAGHGHAEEAAVSDLDRPLEDLRAERCEHGIPTYTCDECRYEVGFVKAPPELFDPARGGTLRTARVERRAASESRDYNGEVRLDSSRSAYIGPRAAGAVAAIHADLGRRVEKGQVLYTVDSPEARREAAGYLKARAAADLARATVRREEELFARKICPQKDLLEAQAALSQAEADQASAEGNLRSMGFSAEQIGALAQDGTGEASGILSVRAPFAGTVLEQSLHLGASVAPGDPLLLLGDDAVVWVLATVYEGEVAVLEEARRRGPVAAAVTVTAFPGREFAGTVDRLEGTLDESTRSLRVRLLVPNPDGALKAGMFARARLALPGGTTAAAVPAGAVMEDEGRSFVFVRVEGPYFVRRPVRTGGEAGGWVLVPEGVAEGDDVVAQGTFLLKSDVLRSKMGAGCAD
jgi:cobalt-zinc-cadmium efflux system membrane fusion protein